MYEVFWNTFMAKPAIDLGVVPDFMRIIFSVHKDVGSIRIPLLTFVLVVPC